MSSATTPRHKGGNAATPVTASPSFLIIGEMKCGTTSLADWLRGHPDVFMSEQKELHFFDLNWSRGLDWYRAQFDHPGSQRLTGEATPHYLYERDARARMAEALPGSRLIVILRDPVSRAYSHYWHNRTRGREPLSFEAALEAEPARISSSDPHDRIRYSYLDRGHYARHLAEVYRHYPRERVLIVQLSEMNRDPVSTFKSVCRYLGVRDDAASPEVGASKNRFVRYRSVRLREFGMHAPKPISKLVSKLNAISATYPPMSPATRARLTDLFRPSNAELGKMIGQDLSSWDR
jgi:hypothetical protein